MSDDDRKPAGDAMPFTAEEAMAFMQRMWNPFAMPMPAATAAMPGPGSPPPSSGAPVAVSPGSRAPSAGAAAGTSRGGMEGMLPGMLAFPNPAAMFAALDPAEVERKIGELKVIEGWLAMSLNLIQMSIKTLELQLASLEALQGSQLRGSHPPAARKRARREPAG